DFNINNVNITGSNGSGIGLVNATGIGRVFDVRSNNNGGAGFGVDNTGGDLQLRIDRMDVNRNLTGLAISGTGAAQFNVIARTVDANDNSRNGIDIRLDTASSIVGEFTNISADNNNRVSAGTTTGDGFHLEADASVASLIISHS